MDSTSGFKFRDHQDNMDSSAVSDTSADISSTSYSDPVDVDDDNDEDDSDLQSMTAKGIKHLCWELLELKAASDEDFQRNIFANYSTFVRVLEEAEDVENELMKLKTQVSNQKKLVNALVDGVYAKLLPEETIEPFSEESASDESNPSRELENHVDDVSEALDILLSENKVDEALDVLEIEDAYIKRLQLEGDFSTYLLDLYNATISERKITLMLQLTSEAENPRTTAPELHKALVGLIRLGDNRIAIQLLLKHYHTRIAARLHHFQDSKAFLGATSMKGLARFVFSLISQATRSFQMLHGESYHFARELVEWVSQETEAFAACFNSYIRSISQISGGLSTVVQSVEFAISFCSLLRTQQLDSLPGLVKRIRPCVVEVLDMHINHFKKVLGVFTASDSWVLCEYLVSGIMVESYMSDDVGKEPEYCFLTTSGRKLLTLLQAIAEDMSPLVALKMENLVISCLIDLFIEYVSILKKFISMERDTLNKGKYATGISFEILMQQISVLANLSTLEDLFSRIVRCTFHSMSQYVTDAEHRTLDSFSSIQEVSAQVRVNFCSQFACRVMSTQYDKKIIPEVSNGDQEDSSISHSMMPSMPLQELFLELKKIETLAEHVDNSWLKELLRELIEATYVWISENKMIFNNDEEFNQFILDMHFLVEMVKHGGYFSNKPILLMTLMKSSFLSVGLDPERDIDKDKWAIDAAAKAIAKLFEIEKQLNILQPGEIIQVDADPHDLRSRYGSEMVLDCCINFSGDAVKSEESMGAFGALTDFVVTETYGQCKEVNSSDNDNDIEEVGAFKG